MSAMQLLNEAYQQGISLSVVGGKISCRSSDPVSPDMVSRLKENKQRIIQILAKPGRRPAITTLKKMGWTDNDLYRKHLPVGLFNLTKWNDPTVTVKLIGNVLFLTWINQAGKKITQTCRPEPRWQENR